MKAFGAMSVSISGKGPTIFGIFESMKDLGKVEKILQKQYKKYFISQF
jgi:homoserine kinase